MHRRKIKQNKRAIILSLLAISALFIATADSATAAVMPEPEPRSKWDKPVEEWDVPEGGGGPVGPLDGEERERPSEDVEDREREERDEEREVHADPKHPLHNTKRASEAASYNLADDEEEKAKLNSVFSTERFRETVDMKREGDKEMAEKSAEDYQESMLRFDDLENKAGGDSEGKIQNISHLTAADHLSHTDEALPSDGSLYSLKKTSEDTALSSAPTEEAKAGTMGRISNNRLFESKKMKEMGNPEEAEALGQEYNSTMERFESFSQSSDNPGVERMLSGTFSQQNEFLESTTPGDDLLYGLKKKGENSALEGITSNETLKGDVLSQISDTRLKETELLSDMGKFDMANNTLKGYKSSVGSLQSLAGEASGDQKTQIEKMLARTTEEGTKSLSNLHGKFPSGKKGFLEGTLNQTAGLHSLSVANLEESLGSLPEGISGDTSELVPSDLSDSLGGLENLENMTGNLEDMEGMEGLEGLAGLG